MTGVGETVVVRPAGPADVAAAADVWRVSHLVRRNGRPLPEERQDRVYGRMTAPGALLLVAEEPIPPPATEPGGDADGVPPPVIGTALALPGREDDGVGPAVPGLLHISLVSVEPDHWGRHVGRLLVETVLERGLALGYQHAQVWTYADNAWANRLYRSAGFRRTGRARIDEWGEFIVHYRRDLAAAHAD